MEGLEKQDLKSWSQDKPTVRELGSLGKGENKTSSTTPGKSQARF